MRGIGFGGIGFGSIGTGIGVLIETEVHCLLTKISGDTNKAAEGPKREIYYRWCMRSGHRRFFMFSAFGMHQSHSKHNHYVFRRVLNASTQGNHYKKNYQSN